MTIPDAFFGAWTLEKNENFDEFLASMGLPWPARKLVLLASPTITITNLGEGRYRMEQTMLGQKEKYEYALGQEIEMKGMDGVMHKVTVTVEDSAIVEVHIKPNAPVDKQVYRVEEGKLVHYVDNGKIACKRYFKRKN